jgi:hypothetical protein
MEEVLNQRELIALREAIQRENFPQSEEMREFVSDQVNTGLKLDLLFFWSEYRYAKFTSGIIAHALHCNRRVDIEDALESFVKVGLVEKHVRQEGLPMYCLTADPEKRQWVLSLSQYTDRFKRPLSSPHDTHLRLFEIERKRFKRMLGKLVPEYDGKYVAILQGVVLDSDRDVRQLAKRIQNEYGDTPVYIGPVGKARMSEIPSPETKRVLRINEIQHGL